MKAGTSLDFEAAKKSYSVTVEVKDGKDAAGAVDADEAADDTIAVTINVTDVGPPGKPEAPTVVADSGTSLDVRWTAPANTGPAISSYDLRYRAGTSGDWTPGPRDRSGTSAPITGLTTGTSYQVQVRATSAEGDSEWSEPGSATTPGTPRVRLSVSPNPVREGDLITVTVTLSAAMGANVVIPLRQTPGTAELGDYGSISGVTIASGATTATYISATVEDDDTDDETYTLSLGTLPSAVIAGSPDSVTVTIIDNDGGGPPIVTPPPVFTPPGVTLSAASVTVSEAGGEARYTVVLDTEPAGAVTVTVASHPETAATVGPQTLVFTPATWNEPQSVTVRGVNDLVDNPGDARQATVSHTVSGGGYAGVAVADVQVTVSDNDAAGAGAAGWLARVGRTLGGQAVNAVTARLEGGGGSGSTLGGVPLKLGELPADALGSRVAPWRHGPHEDAWEVRTMTAEEFLLGTAFHLSAGEEETGDRALRLGAGSPGTGSRARTGASRWMAPSPPVSSAPMSSGSARSLVSCSRTAGARARTARLKAPGAVSRARSPAFTPMCGSP